MITLKIHSLRPTNHAMILSHLRPHALLRQVFRDHVARDGSLLVLRGGIVDGQHLDLMCFIAVGWIGKWRCVAVRVGLCMRGCNMVRRDISLFHCWFHFYWVQWPCSDLSQKTGATGQIKGVDISRLRIRLRERERQCVCVWYWQSYV